MPIYCGTVMTSSMAVLYNLSAGFSGIYDYACGACCFRKALRMGTEVYHVLLKLLLDDGMHVTAVGDEGGFTEFEKCRGSVDYLMWKLLKD